jgi:hypothetical protein
VPEYGTGCFVACGRRQGLLALDLGSIFEKLLHQKTFNFVSERIDFRRMLFLWNPDFSTESKGKNLLYKHDEKKMLFPCM